MGTWRLFHLLPRLSSSANADRASTMPGPKWVDAVIVYVVQLVTRWAAGMGARYVKGYKKMSFSPYLIPHRFGLLIYSTFMESQQPLLKTPINYYGGKHQMLRHILPKIPQHHTYVEPFFGGGAVFWGKPESKAEVINDANGRLITFYKVLKHSFDDLKELIDETFQSRQQHAETGLIYKGEITDELQMAWAVWVQTNLSFGRQIGSGWSYDRKGKCALRISNKKEQLTQAYQERMKLVTIENNDVFKVIKAYDSPDTFFYFDPPYVSANQGHYAGYTEEDFIRLLEACAKMEGKFLLSCYPEQVLLDYRQKYGWASEDNQKIMVTEPKNRTAKVKVECLTWNY